MTGLAPADDNDWLSHTQLHMKHSCGSVTSLLARREISPRTRCLPKKHWGEPPKPNHNSRDARRSLYSWVEAESLGLLSAKYCSLIPPPRSTIAVSFSSDAKSLASTHGDHTIKIIDPETGRCLKVFRGHQRSPWTTVLLLLLLSILKGTSLLSHQVASYIFGMTSEMKALYL